MDREGRLGPVRATTQVCGVDAVQLTRFAKKPIRTGSESMKSVLLVDATTLADAIESALSPGDNWLPRAIGQ
jgi:hypothetical protein